ncbi:MAG: Ldh family oxidoreductase, partial [Halodesulfurarchaeum sp.]|nr:Ldh family oxidoreductase [Halodesulfurarchaeum sp.]
MELSVADLEELVNSVFENEGFSEEEAKISTDEIVDAHCRGRTTIGASYVTNLKGWKDGEPDDVEVIGDAESFRLIEGNGAVGTYVSVEAMDLAMEMADSQGIGIVGVNNATPFLAAGYNPRRAAEEGYIGMNWCNGGSTVAMYGGAEPVIGTNPIGVGI